MSRPPGPKGHPLHGSWPELRADPLTFLLDGALTYGDFFRFRVGLRRSHLLSDPVAIHLVLRDHEGFTDKTPSHRMQDAYPRSVSRLEGREHLERRRALAPAFQREAVLSRAPTGMQAVRGSLERLAADRIQPILPALEDMALRSACALLMGDEGARVAPHVAAAQPRVESWLAGATNDEVACRDAGDALAASIREAAMQRRARGISPHVDVLDPLVKAVDEGQIDEQAMIDEIVMMLVTHVPVAASVGWALLHLARRPELASRLAAEIDGIDSRERELDTAPWLSAVALEVLRLHPPVWVLAREARRPFRYGPYTMDPGDEILMSPYVMQRLPRYWERPEDFCPERFLSGSACDERPAAAYLPFGLGMRKCIGERTALLQMKLMLAALLGARRFELLEGYEPSAAGRRALVPRDGLPLRVLRPALSGPPASRGGQRLAGASGPLAGAV